MQENWSGSTGFSRQRNWNGLPFPSPGDLPNAGTEPASPDSPALAGGFFTTELTRETSIVPLSTHKKNITEFADSFDQYGLPWWLTQYA